MTIEEMFKIIRASGLRMMEVAALFRIAASTLYHWENGECKPQNPLIYNHAVLITTKIKKAIDNGLFPLNEVKGAERKGAIKAILAKMS